MKKWQELALNALQKLGVALVAIGIVGLSLEKLGAIPAGAMIATGVGLWGAVIWMAKRAEEG